MKRYRVEIPASVHAEIAAQARYIALEAKAPMNALRWIQRMRGALRSLAYWPRRAGRAAADECSEFEVRQLVVGSHLVLFVIDDDQLLVKVVGIRHGHRRPRGDGVSELGVAERYWPAFGENGFGAASGAKRGKTALKGTVLETV